MTRPVRRFALLLTLLILLFDCSSGSTPPAPADTVSMNTVIFDPSAGSIPLPNILATAASPAPLAGRGAGKPMNPAEALSYVNRYEVGGTHAVSGVNAPIYVRFA